MFKCIRKPRGFLSSDYDLTAATSILLCPLSLTCTTAASQLSSPLYRGTVPPHPLPPHTVQVIPFNREVAPSVTPVKKPCRPPCSDSLSSILSSGHQGPGLPGCAPLLCLKHTGRACHQLGPPGLCSEILLASQVAKSAPPPAFSIVAFPFLKAAALSHRPPSGVPDPPTLPSFFACNSPPSNARHSLLVLCVTARSNPPAGKEVPQKQECFCVY